MTARAVAGMQKSEGGRDPGAVPSGSAGKTAPGAAGKAAAKIRQEIRKERQQEMQQEELLRRADPAAKKSLRRMTGAPAATAGNPIIRMFCSAVILRMTLSPLKKSRVRSVR